MGLLIGFGNQVWVLFEGVGEVAARSAAREHRFYDGLAEATLFKLYFDLVKFMEYS